MSTWALVAGTATLPFLSSSTGWLSDCAPSRSPGSGGFSPLCCAQKTSPADVVCSFLPSLSNICMQRPLGGYHPPSCSLAPSSVICPGTPGSPGPHLQLTKVAPSGSSHHTNNWAVIIRLGFQGWALVGSPGSPIWTLQWSREGLWQSLPPPHLLPTPRSCLILTISWDRSWVFCLGHASQSWGLERPGAMECPLLFPHLWWG